MMRYLSQLEDLKEYRKRYEECLIQEIEDLKKKKRELKKSLDEHEQAKNSLMEEVAFNQARMKSYEEMIKFHVNEVEGLEGKLKVLKDQKNTLDKEFEEEIEENRNLRISNAKLLMQNKEMQLCIKTHEELDARSKKKVEELEKENLSLKEKLEIKSLPFKKHNSKRFKTKKSRVPQQLSMDMSNINRKEDTKPNAATLKINPAC